MAGAKPVSGKSALSGQLGELILHLQQIQSAVVVSAAALRRQNCELDDDIANVLQRSVADRLQDQIERVAGALLRYNALPHRRAGSSRAAQTVRTP